MNTEPSRIIIDVVQGINIMLRPSMAVLIRSQLAMLIIPFPIMQKVILSITRKARRITMFGKILSVSWSHKAISCKAKRAGFWRRSKRYSAKLVAKCAILPARLRQVAVWQVLICSNIRLLSIQKTGLGM